jgi:hypothetical protein
MSWLSVVDSSYLALLERWCDSMQVFNVTIFDIQVHVLSTLMQLLAVRGTALRSRMPEPPSLAECASVQPLSQ